MPSRVNWYAEDVLAVVDGASAEMMEALAFQVEAVAKTKAAVDTGFMRNSGYVVTQGVNTFQARSEEIDGQQHDTVNNPEPAPPNGATVGFAADYSIFVETRQPFLYPALQQVMQTAGGTIESVGKRHFS